MFTKATADDPDGQDRVSRAIARQTEWMAKADEASCKIEQEITVEDTNAQPPEVRTEGEEKDEDMVEEETMEAEVGREDDETMGEAHDDTQDQNIAKSEGRSKRHSVKTPSPRKRTRNKRRPVDH